MTLEQTIQSIEDKLNNLHNTNSIVDHLWNIDTFLENHQISHTLTKTERWHQEVQLWQKYISSQSAASRNCFSIHSQISHSTNAKAIKRNFEVELAGRVILSEKKILQLKEELKTTLSILKEYKDKTDKLEQLYDSFETDYYIYRQSTMLNLHNTLSGIFLYLFIIIINVEIENPQSLIFQSLLYLIYLLKYNQYITDKLYTILNLENTTLSILRCLFIKMVLKIVNFNQQTSTLAICHSLLYIIYLLNYNEIH